MPIVDVVLTAAFGGAGFVLGFCIRGALLGEGEAQPIIPERSERYEPPRRNERL